MMGAHAIHHRSSFQSVVALSSADAEFNAIVKSVSELLGLKDTLAEFGFTVNIDVCTDSPAANGIAHRQGSGCKKTREANLGDALTHYWSIADGQRHFMKISCVASAAD